MYFDKEEEREKYQEFSMPTTDVEGIITRKRQKAYRLQGDRQAMRFYKDAYDNKKWFGDFTPNQIKKIYKEAL